MRFSLRLNNDLQLPDYIALARAAESAGFDQIWISNDLFLRSGPVILAAVAQATERIEIGSGILNPYTIHPAELSMLAATMDELSGNRFNLGLASGAGEFLKWIGIEQVRPLTFMRETIIAIRSPRIPSTSPATSRSSTRRPRDGRCWALPEVVGSTLWACIPRGV